MQFQASHAVVVSVLWSLCCRDVPDPAHKQSVRMTPTNVAVRLAHNADSASPLQSQPSRPTGLPT